MYEAMEICSGTVWCFYLCYMIFFTTLFLLTHALPNSRLRHVHGCVHIAIAILHCKKQYSSLKWM